MTAGRLVRIVTLLSAVASGSLAYLANEPLVVAAQARLDDERAELHSDAVAFAAAPRLRAERTALLRRYEPLFAQNAQAAFLRDLARIARMHHSALISTSVSEDSANTANAAGDDFRRTNLVLEVRGSYPNVLKCIAALSRGIDLVRVGLPTLRRAEDSVNATIPVTIYEPALRIAQ